MKKKIRASKPKSIKVKYKAPKARVKLKNKKSKTIKSYYV